MKRIFAGMAAALLAAILFFPLHAEALSAEKAIVYDAVSERILYEKKADERSLIASTTKIMTCLVICEQCNVLDRMQIPKEAVGIEGSSMYLQEGEVLTIQDLLYGLMLRSGNDAAVALAIYCGGTVEGFAQLMNDKAHKLGLTETHFENPNGLDSPGHYSTAKDLAILSAYAMKNPIFAKIVSTKHITAGGRSLQNHNKLLRLLEGADGVKTGFTKAAGRILVSSATRQNRRLVAVTINAPDDWHDHIALLNDNFTRYHTRDVVKAGDVLGYVEIAGGTCGRAELVAAEDFSYSFSNDESADVILQEPGFVYAPVAQGQTAGAAYICIGDEVVGRIPLVFGSTVEQKQVQKRTIWEKLFMR